MKKTRSDEIERLIFYRYIDNLIDSLTSSCDNSEVAFDFGRYVAMMQKDIELELAKEIKENEV